MRSSVLSTGLDRPGVDEANHAVGEVQLLRSDGQTRKAERDAKQTGTAVTGGSSQKLPRG